MKKILITGANSYIGTSFEKYIQENYPKDYIIQTVDMIGNNWKEKDFLGYDSVFHVAGIAHIKETAENRHLYYDVNRDLAVKVAKVAKESGVNQFILLSTMSVYGLTVGHIKKDTPTHPINAYGESKVQADEEIKNLEDRNFKFACLRPPMVYGKGCKGNYQSLRKFALKSPIFPDYQNARSMVYIENLCEFVKNVIEQEKSGLFFPQNSEYVNTSKMVKEIAEIHGNKMRLTKAFSWMLKFLQIGIVNKVFGDLTYEAVDTVSNYGFKESIKRTEQMK